MTRRCIATILALALGLGLAGCNGTAQASSPAPATNAAASGIMSRTTARDFADTPVTQEEMDSLLEAAFASPTATGQRSWEFVYVTQRERMAVIQEAHGFSQALDTAPLVIVLCMNRELTRYEEEFWLDCGIATQSILVRASELGLASVPMSIAPVEGRMAAAAEALDLPDHVQPMIMVAVGHPSSDAVTSASVEFHDDSKFHMNSY